MRSLRRHLQLWVLGALGFGSLCLLLTVYALALEELDEVYDENLKQVALAVATQLDFPNRYPPEVPQNLLRPIEVDSGRNFVTQGFDSQRRLVTSSTRGIELPPGTTSGIRRIRLQGHRWYIYTIITDRGIAVAGQRASLRRQQAEEISFKFVLALVALLVFMAGLLGFALRRGLRPFDAAARQIARRSAESLAPLPANEYPVEFRPLVEAVNRLMDHLGAALGVQQRFVADAAHELRTPITALKLQMQLLKNARTAPRRAAAEHELTLGIERAQRLVLQLLDLSRTPPSDMPFSEVDLRGILTEAVTELSVLATDRQIDLGLLPGGPARIDGLQHDLRTLIVNLLDNAIRYTPRGGRVDADVQPRSEGVVLTIEDTGPGIPAGERERVFDRFYRLSRTQADDATTVGSGIGLAVVQAIVERHSGQIILSDGSQGRGLRVTVVFPRPSGQTQEAAAR